MELEHEHPPLAMGPLTRRRNPKGVLMDVTGSEELREFLDSWQDDPLHIKKSFTEFMDFLAAHSNMSFTFKARPGVS